MNIKKIKNIILAFLSVFVFSFSFFGITNAKEGNPINVYIFHGETCPHCKKELQYLDDLSKKYNFDLKKYEVYYNKQNRELMDRFAKAYNTSFNGVPVVIVGYEYIIGDKQEDTERLIKQYGSQSTYEDPYAILLEYENTNVVSSNIKTQTSSENSNSSSLSNNSSSSFKIFGKTFNIKEIGPVFFGVILGLADGINPCMFGVLMFLLTYLISIGSKKKVLISGIVFIVSTFSFYYLAMYGMHNLLFNVSAFLPYIAIFKIVIGVLAIIFALLEIKDFFFYGKGVSLKIPSFAKPIIELIGKRGTYFSAFLLALFSSIVELPCTIGIPLTYIAATEKKINIFLSLFIYNLAFIIPLIIIVTTVYLSSDKFKNGEKTGIAEEKYKKVMRLIAGIILLTMGTLLILGKI